MFDGQKVLHICRECAKILETLALALVMLLGMFPTPALAAFVKRVNDMQIRTHSPEETEGIGRKIAAKLLPGDIIAYYGDLGAGKTAFTRGLAAGLGVTEQVTSPTYTIVNEYLSGRMPLFHFDMYRLDSADDLFDIGWEDYLARGGVCAVEWSENVEEALSGAIRITIHKDPADENVRTITIEGGERFADLGV